MFHLPDLTRKRALLTPERIAFHDVATAHTVTYAQLDDRANRFAEAATRHLGLLPGDRIAILTHNRSVFFEILFACAKACMVLVPLNWRQTPSELVPLIDDCGAQWLLHDAPCADLAARVSAVTGTRTIAIDDPEDAGASYSALVEQASGDAFGPDTWEEDQLWYLLYTSGTTGLPKAVVHTPGMALANMINISLPVGITDADTTVNFLPLFHTAGINLYTLPVLMQGGTVHVMDRFDPDTLIDLMESGAVTIVFCVPAIYQALTQHPRFAATDLSRVRSWGCGGAPLPARLIEAFAARGAMIQLGFGMTETGPTVFLMDRDRVTDKLGSIGKPQLLTDVRLVRPDGQEAEIDEPGELWIRGPGVTPGYFNRPEATADALTPDGWLKSGDVACRDADGYYAIVDRIKDMYISGGENVYPAEIERVLAIHPEVLEAAVIGVSDAKWGEVGRAYILPRPGAAPEPDALITYCRTHLAGYKVPRDFVLVDDLPRTAAGKVRKHLLGTPGVDGARP